MSEDDDISIFQLPKKKPKKKIEVTPAASEEKDYMYIDMLHKAFVQYQKEFPERLSAISKKDIKHLPKIELAHVGGKLTMWSNSAKFCAAIKRDKEHIRDHFQRELRKLVSYDALDRMIIREKLQISQVQTILKRYMKHYVVCPRCNCIDTLLQKDLVTRSYFIKCQICMANTVVTTEKDMIKTNTMLAKDGRI
jgi:translation initiation factor 2 subunit 2